MMRVRVIISASVLLACLFYYSGTAIALQGANVALYNDSKAPIKKGAWQDGLTAIKSMLTNLGLTYEEISYTDLNSSSQDFSSLYKIILFPGGYAPYYNWWINSTGKERIRTFVRNGGGYFGICAGAYFAVDRVAWGGMVYDDSAGYDLDLFQGTGAGDEDKITDYYAGNWSMLTFNFNTTNTVAPNYKAVPYTEDIIYLGGPYFTADSGTAFEVLATFADNGQPGIIAFQYGSGRVVLSGPHPEIEEDSNRDGVTIQGEDSLNDNGSDWELTRHILNWLIDPANSQTIAVPSKQESFSFQPIASPIKSSVPSAAKPVGSGLAASGGSTLSLGIGTNKFASAVDIYFALFASAIDPVNTYIMKTDNTFQPLSAGLTQWKPANAGPINENIFGDLQTASLPSGTYNLYFMVTPQGSLSSYYLWSTYFSVP